MAIEEAIIAPFKYMEYLCPLGHIELVLSNWLSNSDYARYYYNASQKRRFIILDNGIMELGHAIESESLINFAMQLRPALITPPEILNDGPSTLQMTYDFLKLFEKSDLYPETKLLGIAHGRSFDEWVFCFEELIKIPMVARIGVPYDIPFDIQNCNNRDREPRLNVLVERRIAICNWIAEIHPEVSIHLLGLAHASELRIQARHTFIKSNDSSLATMAALHGIRYENLDAGPFIKYLINFDAEFKLTALELAKHNIQTLINYSRKR